MIAARGAALAGAGALAALVAGCGSLDTGEGSKAIASQIKRDTGAEAVKVDCPNDVKQKKGEGFSCTATVDGTKVSVPVTQTDDNGNVRFAPRVVKTRQVEQEMEKRANARTENTQGARAQCPTVVALNPGASFSCTVQTPGPDFAGKATQVGTRGEVTIELKRGA